MRNSPDNKPLDLNQNVSIEKKLTKITGDLSQEQQQRIIKFVTHEISHFSGPLPPPEILKEYEKLLSGSAERIFKMAEKQQDHTINLENHITKTRLKQINRASVFAFILGITGIISASFLAVLGYDVFAGVLATTTIGSLACAFIIQNKNK